MDFKFNVNYGVRVKLTDRGINLLKERRRELNKAIEKRGGIGFGEYEPNTDAEGYTKFAMWDLMNSFGHLMGMGSELPFDTEIIITKGTPINDNREMEK